MSLIPAPLRRGVEALIDPIVGRLVALRVRPNAITTVGTLVLAGAGVSYGYGLVQLGGALLIASGVFDMLDGRVARRSGGTTAFGAFYDSTLDRIGEAALFGGIVFFFMKDGVPPGWRVPAVSLALTALAAGLIVSYARARAEGLGLECAVGLVQRAERILVLGVPSLFFGAGPNGFLLFAIVGLLALVNTVTVGQRIAHVYRITRPQGPEADGHDRSSARATKVGRVTPELAQHLGGKGRRGD